MGDRFTQLEDSARGVRHLRRHRAVQRHRPPDREHPERRRHLRPVRLSVLLRRGTGTGRRVSRSPSAAARSPLRVVRWRWVGRHAVSLVDTAAVEVVLGLVPCRAGDSTEVNDRSSPRGSPRSTARSVSTAWNTPRITLQRGSGDRSRRGTKARSRSEHRMAEVVSVNRRSPSTAVRTTRSRERRERVRPPACASKVDFHVTHLRI